MTVPSRFEGYLDGTFGRPWVPLSVFPQNFRGPRDPFDDSTSTIIKREADEERRPTGRNRMGSPAVPETGLLSPFLCPHV